MWSNLSNCLKQLKIRSIWSKNGRGRNDTDTAHMHQTVHTHQVISLSLRSFSKVYIWYKNKNKTKKNCQRTISEREKQISVYKKSASQDIEIEWRGGYS